MSWLSLATRVAPQLWKIGSKATSVLFDKSSKIASSIFSKSSEVASTASSIVVKSSKKGAEFVKDNPKVSAAAAAACYAGWKNIGTDDSLGTSVGKSLRDATDGAGGFTHDVINGFTGDNTVEQAKETTQSVVNGISETAKEGKDLLGGLGNMISGLTNMLGSGISMVTNMFSNIGAGKLSGLGIAGLIASAYMIFGRSGILGKIGGVLLGMMLLSGNSQHQQQTQTFNQGVQEDRSKEEQQQSNRHR